MINVQITHDYTSGGKPCGVESSMTLRQLNYIVAWLQRELDTIAETTPLIEDDCVELLCKFYGCTKTSDGWERELNLCDNWDNYVCGSLCGDRRPFVDACANAEALEALKKLAIEMEASRK